MTARINVYNEDIKMLKGQRYFCIYASCLLRKFILTQHYTHKKDMYVCFSNFYTFLRKKSNYIAVLLMEYCYK